MSHRYHIKRQLAKILATGALAFICQAAWSSGFQTLEQNVTNLGTAYAGTAALAIDASTGFYNPAGLTRICKEQVVGSLVWVQGHPNLQVNAATTTFGLPSAAAPGGFAPTASQVGGTKATAYALIPALHYATPICDAWHFGFNITSPYGLRNNYKIDSVARYMATRSDLRTIDFSPSIAYRFADGFSVGVGVDALYLNAKLDQRLGRGIGLLLPPSVLTDGYIENSADGWGWGYHAGILWEVNSSSRIGASYRSRVRVKPKGESLILGPSLAAGGGIPAIPFTRAGIRTTVTLPETATISAYHSFSDCWAAMADVSWTHWKRFRSIVLTVNPSASASYTQTTREEFKDSYRLALGGTYSPFSILTIRAGVAFDRTPVRDAFRNVRIPDSNRTWAAVGVQYRFSKCMALDVGYAHLFFKRATVIDVAPISTALSSRLGPTLQGLTGNNKMAADIIGLQLTWDIG